MALIKIYTEKPRENNGQIREEVLKVARVAKIICAAALNSREIPTGLSTVETVLGEGIDLIGIDYILEIIACERGNEDGISRNIIDGLNQIFPRKYFSVYFNLVREKGMANTPRPEKGDVFLTMEEAIKFAKEEVK